MYQFYNNKCVRPPGRAFTILLLIAVFLSLSAGTLAQKVTLSEKNATLKNVFEKISKQTGFDFLVSTENLKLAKPVTITVKDEELKPVLEKIFTGQPLSYVMQEKMVVVSKKEPKPVKITGSVTDTTGTPLIGATIKIRGSGHGSRTDRMGLFSILGNAGDDVDVSFIGFITYSFKVSNDQSFDRIVLRGESAKLNEVRIVSTGYQSLSAERATGSFDQIDNKLLNRSISTNILDRLDGVAGGLIFNKNPSVGHTSSSAITIRGISTIYANQNPLIVVDNFPYSGDLSSINPNDVESVTVLKDAAAAAIWGAFSANGVIVITTKKGKKNQAPKIEINSNITIGDKPNLYYSPQLSSADYISVEQYLFKQGFYDNALSSSSYPLISPVIDMLNRRRGNLISSADSTKLIGQYKGQDARRDESKYLYRRPANQQYNMNISGGGNNSVYYFSAGYDKNLQNINRNDFDRISINGTNTYTFFNNKLELSNAVYFTKNTTDNDGLTSSGSPYPYVTLKDANGNNAAVPYKYNARYIDTAGHGNLLDWHYRPLDELALNNNYTTLNEYRINTSLKYTIIMGLNASLQYQYDQGNSNGQTLYNAQSFYVRDYVNQFTQYNSSANTYVRPVPAGGILDKIYQTFTSQNVRGQINYNHQWKSIHNLSVLGGVEVRDITTDYNTNRVYGYDDLGSAAAINYQTAYIVTPSGIVSNINSNLSELGTTNRFVSYFANAAYTYNDRYIISASGRKDESNIFGVSTNQKGVPLWSVGGSWEVNKEKFYHIGWLPYLRLRITNGYQGNVDNALSALVTATTNSALINSYAQPVSTLSNPPNPELRWEKVNTTNFAADFSFKYFLSGSIEYYIKKGSDLIGTSPVDPTTGVATFTGNTADMQGKGIDVTLNSVNVNRGFKWKTAFLLSYTKDKITKYLLKPGTIANELSGISPIIGNPLYSLYGFKWGGLDATGDQQVYLDGKLSKNYSAVYNSTNLSNLQYVGTASPTTFGSIRNDFSWKQFSLSANITYKLGYYFKRPSVSYSLLFSGSANMPDADFVNRWRKPGDEMKTNVPAMIYPDIPIRDFIYQNASIQFDNADQVRLQDVSLSYDLNKSQFPRMPFTNIKVYAYINNIGILWKANKDGVDPDYIPNGFVVYPIPRTYALGVKVSL